MKTVGIIIPTKKRFDDWVYTWGLPEKKYVWLNNMDKCKGQVFCEVVKSHDYLSIDNAEEILKEAEYRIKK